MKTAKRAWAAVQKCLALINSCPRRKLPSAPEHPNIGTAAAARPRRGCSPLPDFWEEAARPLPCPLSTNCSFPPRRFLVGAGGLGTGMGEGGWLSLHKCPQIIPKTPWGPAKPFYPIKWDRSPLIPCQGQGPQHRAVPLRWGQSPPAWPSPRRGDLVAGRTAAPAASPFSCPVIFIPGSGLGTGGCAGAAATGGFGARALGCAGSLAPLGVWCPAVGQRGASPCHGVGDIDATQEGLPHKSPKSWNGGKRSQHPTWGGNPPKAGAGLGLGVPATGFLGWWGRRREGERGGGGRQGRGEQAAP